MATGIIKRNSSGITYSTTEQKTEDKWIDGKPIYMISYTIPSLPNSTTSEYTVGTLNPETIVDWSGYAHNKTTTSGDNRYYWQKMPMLVTGTVGNSILMSVLVGTDGKLLVRVSSAADRSNYTGHVIIYYTKTTD